MRTTLGILSLILIKLGAICGYEIFELNYNHRYKIEANVTIIPDVHKSEEDTITQWSVSGVLQIQRIDQVTLAMQFTANAPNVPKDGIKSLEDPFKMKSLSEKESSHYLMQHPQKVVELPENEPIWSANIKRAIASLFQVEGNSQNGAYVSNEFGLYGLCQTEYYVVNNTEALLISKIYDMDRCAPYPGGIFEIRSNIPLNLCEEKQPLAHAITSRLGDYKLIKLDSSKYLLESIKAETKSNVQATESYYPQFIFTKIDVDLESHTPLAETDRITFNSSQKMFLSGFTYVPPYQEATGGRAAKSSDEIVKIVMDSLMKLSNHLEDIQLNFDEPYLDDVSEIVRLIETMDYETLKKLYDQIDIGTSYIQETSRNIFLEILPRAGTAASVLLTKYLVMEKLVRPTTAVQLLISLPFFISELSANLVKECEEFLHVGNDRPDVKHSAVLSYATIIYKAFVANAISADQFEKYVKTFFDLFLNSFDYEQQMLYLEAMGNLQLGNVANYLQSIIAADYSQTTDIRFLAIFATMPTAYTRPDEIFETYWPIFYSKTTPLQLRIAAFTMLLVSSPTAGRLLGLYNVVKNENCPHMINFYRTTVLSISETTYSCLSHLKRLILYMRRHLPEQPAKKYWITGNYIFDYKDRKFQLGSMLQALLIGDRKRDLPLIIFVKFDTEALGRFTGQVGIYVKARGLSDAVHDRLSSFNPEALKMEDLLKVLAMMKMQPIQSTPLHLEFIVQFEGKSVLSYYLNQTTFYNLTDGDLINRINVLLRADSHINMQIVRRPFMIKHKFSTLIGTPADILIESTLIASIRGSTTQNLAKEKITRNNQIDFRYSSYAVAKIRSYNPVEDIEYSTIREQGFLVYLPLNNEIILNLAEQSMTFSLYRKDSITSGLSLKSRTINFCGKKQISSSTTSKVPSHEMNIEDVGVNIVIGHNVESSKENIMFLFEADVLDNAKVFTRAPYSIMQNILTLVSIIQLTSVHISRDKHLTILLTNQPKSKLEGMIRWETEDFSQNHLAKEKKVFKVDCSLLHLLDFNDPHPKQLHKWEFSSKYSTFKDSRTSKAMVSLNRKTKDGDKWKLCVSGSFEESEHLKKPFTLTSSIVFGNHESSSKKCPTDKSTVEITVSIGAPEKANAKYQNLSVADQSRCTKEIVRFSPVSLSENCKQSQFNDILAVTDYNVNIKFERMPSTFYEIASRIDHMLSAVLPGSIDKLNVSEHFDFSVKLPTNEIDPTRIKINNVSASVPLSCDFNYGNMDQLSVDYGFTSICTLYKNNLNSFVQKSVELNQTVKVDNSLDKEVLFVAECSDKPRLAIFIGFKGDSNDFNYVKIYTAGHVMTVRADGEPIITFNGEQHNIKESSFEYPPFQSDFKVSLKDASVIEIENFLIESKIQYNLKNLISVSLPTPMRGKLCGLCKIGGR